MSRQHAERGARWRGLRRQVLARADYACQACGARGRKLECDHIVPLEEGGQSELANLQALCRDCHHAKTRKENGFDMPALNEWAQFAMASRFQRARP